MAGQLPSGLHDAVARLDAKREVWRRELDCANRFMTNDQDVQYMVPALADELGDRIAAAIVALPLAIVDAFENRLDVEGFRFPGQPSGDADLWEIWQSNDMDAQSQQGHFDAIGLSRAAAIVGARDGSGLPLITVESALDCVWDRRPHDLSVARALKAWKEDDGSMWRSLYLPGVRYTLTSDAGEWRIVAEDSHGIDRIPVVPLVNRPRLRVRDGRSEFEPLIPLINAINKMATDMMVSAEYHAMPRRWVFGMKKSDFIDPKTGKAVTMWSKIAGRIWANENADVKVGQFPEADLGNFRQTIRMILQVSAQLAGLPPHYFAEGGQNPASADAIRSAETQLVKRVERKQTYFGQAWEEVARVAMLFRDGDLMEGAHALETVWRDPATPTKAQTADATVKLVSARGADGRPLMPTPMARRELGWTDAQLREADQMERDSATMSMESVLPLVAGVGGG